MDDKPTNTQQAGANGHSDQRLVSAQVPIFLSLGAGVQSSCMALMAVHGEIPMPHCAIFADTQAEPSAVYEWLDWLEAQLPYPVHRVTAGSLDQDTLQSVHDPKRHRVGQAPYYVINGCESVGTLWRKCTGDYKVAPLRREQRQLMRVMKAKRGVTWIGISLDEAHRMKESRVRYLRNEYPLIDKRMTRHDCKRWMDRHGYPQAPKSACRFCPYTNDARWKAMKETQAEDWQKAVAFDAAIRTGLPGVKGKCYVHRSCKPLDAVDFSNEEDRGQQDMFGNECEGLCGV